MLIEADAILFDNDGVLVDSRREVERAWTQLANEFGLDAERLLIELIGRRSADTLGDYLPPERCRQAVDRLEDLEVEMASETRPLAGALELLEQLGEHRWTIATSAARRLANARWTGAGIAIPSQSITAEDVSNGKPDPEPFLAGARLLGVDPARCIVFEDSPSGGAAALAAGATAVAVGHIPWAFEPAARVADLRSVRVIASGGEPPQGNGSPHQTLTIELDGI
ncbi:MAG: HAD-IA family hydrolase [Acidimicrobiales bacterium]